MVIQRWQTLFLLVSVILMACMNFLPVVNITSANISEPVGLTQFPILIVLTVTTAVMLFIDMFLYKNLRLQIRTVLVCLFLMIATAITGACAATRLDGCVTVAWTGAPLLLGCAFLLALGALRFMRADQRLLQSVDRLR